MRWVVERAAKRLVLEAPVSRFPVPLFLCPAWSWIALPRPTPRPHYRCRVRNYSTPTTPLRNNNSEDVSSSVPLETPQERRLPLCCPGCGAPVQLVEPDQAGYYNLERAAVKYFLKPPKRREVQKEEEIYEAALKTASPEVLEQIGVDHNITHFLHGVEAKGNTANPTDEIAAPLCERCHNLIHHRAGAPIHHPSIESIADTIAESPHKVNHVYHVLDAADFPMSLIRNIQRELDLAPLRTKNRRSKSLRYHKGRISELSFIITRSDLLAPTKEQVDHLMTYLVDVLRDALGRTGKNVRLGNVRCVSSKRGWWTKVLKQNIWMRGGASWLVGKVNVGKSNLFEVIFPKGPTQALLSPSQNKWEASGSLGASALENSTHIREPEAPYSTPDTETMTSIDESAPDTFNEDDFSLLPPPQQETPYPVMPTVSSLPGTTASPIRIPFGKGKGELIDLPGLVRSGLEEYIQPEHHMSLVMTRRVTPEKCVLKPGQSLLLLGGLIRITPTTPDLVFLAHSFVPLEPHVTSTEKAIGIHSRTRDTGVALLTKPDAGTKMASAGRFQLSWDVTRQQSGPLTAHDAGKLKPLNLPFIVYSADILIEGVGWVELIAQVRKGRKPQTETGPLPVVTRRQPNDAFTRAEAAENAEEVAKLAHRPSRGHIGAPPPPTPEVEIFSPEGKFIGIRPPMGASLLCQNLKSKTMRRGRPRQSMVSVKAQRKKQPKAT